MRGRPLAAQGTGIAGALAAILVTLLDLEPELAQQIVVVFGAIVAWVSQFLDRRQRI